jgi:hypothetical protein
MACFGTKTFIKHDDYCSPKYVWENIKQFIPKDKVIYEPFYCNGESGKDLQDMGYKVIHEPVDFFEYCTKFEYDILVSNPPFSLKKEIYTKLIELDKPFIMISPSSLINTQYMRKLFNNNENKLQIIIPRKRIQFTKKLENGEYLNENRANFDCFYYTYKMNLKNDITWLE